MSNQNLHIDEFGRDLSLKKDAVSEKELLQKIYDYIDFMSMYHKFIGKSWVDIETMLEEEEEKEQQKQDDKTFQKELEKRRYMLSINQYDLEEGEVLE